MLPLGKNPPLLVGVGYVLAALALDWVSDIGLYRGIGVTPWSPASGLSVAFVYVYGAITWPYVLAAEFCMLLFRNPAGFPLYWTAPLAGAITLIWLAGGSALRRLPEFDPRLGSSQSLVKLIAVGVCQAAAHCAAYVGVLWTSGRIGRELIVPASWRHIVGILVGILVVAPLPMMLSAGWRLPRLTAIRVLQMLLLVCTVGIVFNYPTATTYQLFYLLFLPVMWTALRDGIGSAALILNVAQVGIIIGTQMRSDVIPGTGSLQVLMTALALTGLLVGAVVSDRQAAGQRLRDQHAALGRALRLRSAGETAAAISHQINQPITAISTYASVARDALQNNNLDLVRSALDKLTAECDRAAAVARSIRDLVKQGALERAPARLSEVVMGLQHAHAAECAALNMVFEIDIPGNLPTIYADSVQLEQAIDNLITNSVESMRDGKRGSRLRVSARIVDGDVLIDVEDDGPGFAPGLDALATTPFMTTKANGSGLGLAIARSVAEAHGGSLAIVHRSAGACVRLRLPFHGNQNGKIHQHH